MRKYDIKNKRNFIIVAIVGIILIVIFSLFVKRIIDTSKIEYTIPLGSIILDKDKNINTLEEDGIIKVKWNKEYYLLYQDKQIEIGNTAIVFNPNNAEVNLYGKFYQVNEKADVYITEGETIIKNTILSKFYKINDRKYLLIDKEITSEDGGLNTTNYLLVELDKLGNATLSNNEVSLKTFTPTVIKTSSYTFDIANETVNFNGVDIDLKKIIGTTNEYKKENKVDNEGNGNTNNNVTPNTNNSNNNNQENTTVNSNTANSNTGLNTNENGTPVTDEDIINIMKRSSVIKVTPKTNSISIDYLIYDPRNEYSSVYMEIKNISTSTVNTIYLSKSNTNYVITDLAPSSKYELTFKYTYMEESEYKTDIFENITVTTTVPKVNIDVSKVTNTNIYFGINVNNYSFDSLKVELYSDNRLITSKKLSNITSNINDNFDITEYTLGSFVTLKVTEVISGGKIIDTTSSYKYKNPNYIFG